MATPREINQIPEFVLRRLAGADTAYLTTSRLALFDSGPRSPHARRADVAPACTFLLSCLRP